MKDILTSFENDPDIYRYSWYTGRVNPDWTDMLEGQLLSPTSGVLKPIGTEYINVPYTTKKMKCVREGLLQTNITAVKELH